MRKRISEFWKKNKWLFIVSFIISTLFTTFLMRYVVNNNTEIETITYNEFMELVKDHKVDTVYYSKNNDWMTITVFNDQTKNLTTAERLKYKEYTNEDKRKVLYPAGDSFRENLLKYDIILDQVSEELTFLEQLIQITTILFPIFMIIMVVSILKSSFGSAINKNELIQKSDVKFTDIIGHEEILDDIKFITKLIKDPSLGDSVGAKVPKGILLSGDPGCGKTLIAKAIAGEAGVAFIYQNASSFIDRFVGVGAKHVRDLFKLAKQHTPCIIFIDEIDAIGIDRSKNKGTSENDQTIDALLQAMDGFTGRENIFIIAATNRPEILDPALVRAGRFDRQIIVSKPRDWAVRKELFDHYLAKFKVSDDVNTENLSKQVTGFTGADIAAICNEASIIAIMNEKDCIDKDCIEEAIDKKIFKGNRSKKEKYQKDKEIVAYHESGHAVMSYLLGEPIARASIQSTVSGVGGVVFNEEKESVFQTRKEFEDRVMICYAGRASEEIKFEDITTGASNDITQATALMMQYVETFGFDRQFGLLDISVLSQEHLINSKELTTKLSSMSNKFYDECKDLLQKNYELVEKLAQKLLEVETLTGEEIKKLFENKD